MRPYTIRRHKYVSLIALVLFLCQLAFGSAAETLTITFVGDVSIGDAIQYRGAQNSYHDVINEKGTGWPLSLVSDILLADDLTVANLEGSITHQKKHKDIRYPLVIAPSHMQVLASGGIDVVNTANNHALDFFSKGYEETLSFLDQTRIEHFGTLSPPSSTGINRQAVVSVKGIKVGFIGFTYPRDKDLHHIKEAAAALREEGCKLVILSRHWGKETHMKQNATQMIYAKKALAMDVDLIYGHHPHVIQPIGLFEGKPVLFSTGNFTFGTMSQVDPSTGMFQVSYDLTEERPRLSAIRVLPCLTSGRGDYRPVPVEDDQQRRAIFSKLHLHRPSHGFEALPDSFLETGEAVFR